MQVSLVEQLSDQTILERIRDEEFIPPEVIKRMYQEKGGKGYAFVFYKSKQKEKAKEVLQAAVTSFVLQVKKGKLQKVDNLEAYLYNSCKNIYLNSIKKHKAEARDLSPMGEVLAASEKTSDPLEQKERAMLIRKIMELIDEACRKTLLFSIVEERSMDWIANKMGFANSQVAMNKKSNCKKKLVKGNEKKPAYRQLCNPMHKESQSN